uniref:Succinate:cytochrome c oxidoreductase subunit 3 n=1 Tax=Pyropia kuniedae TaxID=683349 RepID=H3JS58_9RHOD|nr:succinate:cytochrome c oxidoreductase subunit 3 [Pyropia kuniedae]
MHNINRPISPHLTIYSPQTSSIFSIWHRISGFVMFILISSPIFLLNCSYFSYTPNFLASVVFNYALYTWLFDSFRLVISAIFLYHISNGTRHFLWDSVRHVNTKEIYTDSKFLLVCLLLVISTQFYVKF